MGLTLYSHPLASYCWKVLIALYEKGLPFEARMVNLGDPAEKARFEALWPTAKIPLLDDGGIILPETSIIIEHLERYPGNARLIPLAPEPQLHVRLWDRLADCYIMEPMQRYIAQQLRSPEDRDLRSVSESKAALSAGYYLFEQRLGDRVWAAGSDFSMADCAAAPALFYATTIEPIPKTHEKVRHYFDRLMAKPSVARVVKEAGPYFKYYPLQAAIPAHFLERSADAS